MTWQPIETAPKDGTEIIILSTYGAVQAYYDENYDYETGELIDVWQYLDYGYDGVYRDMYFYDRSTDVKFWMPLPARPE